jgi:hypothetical protein
MTVRPTKELLVAAIALAVTSLTIRSRLLTPVSPGAFPRVPPVESPAEVPREDLPVARPRLLAAARATEGRDPFAAADIWEDPVPVALPLPPELPEERIVPVLSIGAGRARAMNPPRVARLPSALKNEEPPAPPPAEKAGGKP